MSDTSLSPEKSQTIYPDNTAELETLLQRLLNHCDNNFVLMPKALIIPHGACLSSGEVAATAYALLLRCRSLIKRVVLLGSTTSESGGITVLPDSVFTTPLGTVSADRKWSNDVLENHETVSSTQEKPEEESVFNAQIPFLQYCLDSFILLPMLIGQMSSYSIAQVLNSLWEQEETLFIVSANLSCYHRYEEAEARDAMTVNAIEQLNTHLTFGQTSGYSAINGLLKVAQYRGLKVTTLARGYSDENSHGKHYTEGYAAFAIR